MDTAICSTGNRGGSKLRPPLQHLPKKPQPLPRKRSHILLPPHHASTPLTPIRARRRAHRKRNIPRLAILALARSRRTRCAGLCEHVRCLQCTADVICEAGDEVGCWAGVVVDV